MADIAPSPSVTKVGSLLLVFAIALLAIYVANNFNTVGQWVSRKTTTA